MPEFEKLGMKEELLQVVRELEFESPSEIQKQAIPLVLSGKDVIGNAATGSGKTLAFAAGIIAKVIPKQGIQALVLTPTRELAIQVAEVIANFSKHTGLKTVEIYGGVNIERQIMAARTAEIIVGTPGRILDHLERRTLNLQGLKILVLDEADRMADMGFLRDVERIIQACPERRQTLLFSATTSRDVDYIEKRYMHSPITVSVEQYVDPSKLKQAFYDVSRDEKFSLLVDLLKKEKSGIVMVFCNTRRNVDMVAVNLKRYGIIAHAIHGGLEQNKRTRIMAQFHNNEADILICTDVAARGLDIKNVTHVYNYDVPKSLEEYIHRIGRTARAGESGMAVTLVTNNDYVTFSRIMETYSIKIEQKELPEFERLIPQFKVERRGFNRGGGNFRGPRYGGSNRQSGFRRNSEDSGDNNGRPRRSFGNRGNSGRRSFQGSRNRFSRRRF
jgi:ATP-dependent RNA helicase DeaD